jgi:hypothetical protein
MSEPGPMLTERERDQALRNADALSWAFSSDNQEERKRLRQAFMDAYMAGVRRDAFWAGAR